MDEKPIIGPRHPGFNAREDHDDPDGGQVMGPHGEAPEDPAARGIFRGCLIALLFIGIVLGISTLVYRMMFAA